MDYINYLLYYSFNFFLYSFVGWILENGFCYFKKKHFQEDGFLFLPLKPMYGIAMTIIISLYYNISSNIFFLIGICFFVPTTVEYITGVLMRKYFNKNYWDYSDVKYNIQGIICLRFSVYWIFLTVIGVKLFQPYVVNMIYKQFISLWIIIIPVLMLALIMDLIFTMISFRDTDNIE
ncbi:MAG: putative ABC transporter permease [Clostridium sp.]|uniref:putative ABC transporter permease n=1 Tax=Clostridium sp. TaxID=1506 RepID=UPI003042BA1A